MKLKKYVIDGLGEPFDGLVVHLSEESLQESEKPLSQILRIQSDAGLFKSFSVPIGEGLYISLDKVKPHEEMEFATDNPFGRYVGHMLFSKDLYEAELHFYHKGVSVTIKNSEVVIYARYFRDEGSSVESVKKLIEWAFNPDSKYDLDGLVFDLGEID